MPPENRQNSEEPKETSADGANPESGAPDSGIPGQPETIEESADTASEYDTDETGENNDSEPPSDASGNPEEDPDSPHENTQDEGENAANGGNGDQTDKNTPAPDFASTLAAKSGQPEDEKEPEGEKNMGLLDHLSELRSRLVKAVIAVAVGFGACWAFVDPIFNILLDPLLVVLPEGTHAQYTTLPEAFFARMQIAFVAGAFLMSPFVFYQIWAFVAPGLYDEEKRYIVPIAIISALFFIAGGLFCYFIVFPFAFNFFISYSTPEIVITPKVSDYLSFVLKLLFAFGLIFEMPIFTLFLSRLGILTAAMMRKGRRYAIVAIFILAAILTPPDVVSQLLMACPMLLLYEVSIGVAVIFGKKPAKKTSTDTEATNGQDKD